MFFVNGITPTFSTTSNARVLSGFIARTSAMCIALSSGLNAASCAADISSFTISRAGAYLSPGSLFSVSFTLAVFSESYRLMLK
jgi:hypothetical protein